MNDNSNNSTVETETPTDNSSRAGLLILSGVCFALLIGLSAYTYYLHTQQVSLKQSVKQYQSDLEIKDNQLTELQSELQNTKEQLTSKETELEKIFSKVVNYADTSNNGDDKIIGSPEDLNENTINGFSAGDSIFVSGEVFDIDDVTISRTETGISLEVDVNQDTEVDFTMYIDEHIFAYLYEPELFSTEVDNGNTFTYYNE